MTREEAIDILKCGRPFDDNPKADLDEFNLALGVAIKAIKNENALLDRVLEIIDKEFGTTQPYCDAYGFIDFALKIKKIRIAVLELKGGDDE